MRARSSTLSFFAKRVIARWRVSWKVPSSIMARFLALRKSASSDLAVMPNSGSSSGTSGSRRKSSAVRRDSGTPRFVQFLVCLSVAVRPTISLATKPHISPARIAVSIANRNATATRWYPVVASSVFAWSKPSAKQIRSISSSEYKRSRAGGSAGAVRRWWVT